ncbi:hypothetical protein G9A89_022197 [Geosiphon pyriformis]|nr:hypothetical protein G9A89_022197 [Geosiphon pyriformis]
MNFDFIGLLERLVEKNLSYDNKSKQKNCFIVIGNESADLDSIIGSLGYAYLNQRLGGTSDDIYLPVIQIPRQDLSLRPECEFVFRECGINTQNFVFIEDFQAQSDSLTANYNVRIVMVDHNKLLPSWERFTDRVDVILDHHQDEGLYLRAQPRWIEPVGSASSLVVLTCRGRWKAEYDENDEETRLWDKKVAKLLLAPILIDTVLLDFSKGRTTSKDQEAANFLLNILQPDNNWNQLIKEYYNSIQEGRYSVFHLQTSDLLRKDYKEWSSVGDFHLGMSSVTWYLDAWIERDCGLDTWIKHLRTYAEKKQLDLFIVMTTYHHPEGFQRELVVYPIADALKNGEFISKLLNSDLNLEDYSSQHVLPGKLGGIFLYQQKNLKWSRKQVYPFLKSVLQSMPVVKP